MTERCPYFRSGRVLTKSHVGTSEAKTIPSCLHANFLAGHRVMAGVPKCDGLWANCSVKTGVNNAGEKTLTP